MYVYTHLQVFFPGAIRISASNLTFKPVNTLFIDRPRVFKILFLIFGSYFLFFNSDFPKNPGEAMPNLPVPGTM
jgi:hypothetical protein